MRLLPAGSGHIEMLAYAPDGSHLAASARPGPTAWLWDLRAGRVQPVREPRTPAPLAPAPPSDLLAPLAYSPSGGLLAVGGERQLSLRDSGTGVQAYFRNVGTHQSLRLAFTPDGQTLVSAGAEDNEDGRRRMAVVLWDVADGRRRKLPVPFPVGTDLLAVTWDGSLLLWCEPSSHIVPPYLTLWHVAGRRPLARRALGASPSCAAFSPSGRQIALSVENEVHLFEIGHVLDHFGTAPGSTPWGTITLPLWWKRFASRLPPLGSPKVLEGHGDSLVALAYLPDGGALLSAADDQTVRRWDLASLRPREVWRWPVDAVSALAVAPDGMTAAVGGAGGAAIVWDLEWF